jgi:AcrR family transcriptional regulator
MLFPLCCAATNVQAARILVRGGSVVNGASGESGHRRTQAQRSAATRGALLAAARVVFAERGFAGAGREEIVAAAGVTRGAMYHHFDSKEDLFVAVVEQVEEEVVAMVASAAMAAEDPIEQLRFGSQAYLDAALDPGMRRICLLDAPAVLSPEQRQAINDRYGLGLVREALARAADEGRVDPDQVEPFAPMLLAALLALASHVAHSDDPVAARAAVRDTVDSLVAGLVLPGR